MEKQQLNSRWKTALFVAVLLFLCLPYLQRKLSLFEEEPLSGYVEQEPRPDLTIENFLADTFQLHYERYVRQQYGFRNSLVRLRNQMDYSFFGLANTTDVVVGKNHCLYESNYIRAYHGYDYVGSEAMTATLDKLEKVKDTLSRLNIKLLLVMAPDKASFFPEYFPVEFQDGHGGARYGTNYKDLMPGLRKRGIPAIDFRKWFISMKKTSKYPLYAMGGIHWSKYGAYLATDSLLRYMNRFTGHRLPKMSLDSIVVKVENEADDYDIAASLNLMFQLPTTPMAYPVFHSDTFPGMVRPNVLVAGDSYYFLMSNYKVPVEYFNNSQFWFYGQQIAQFGPMHGKMVKDVDIAEEIGKQEVLIILSTNRNINGFVMSFVDTLYKTYFP